MYNRNQGFVKRFFGVAVNVAPFRDVRVFGIYGGGTAGKDRFSTMFKFIEIPAGHPVARYLAHQSVFFACKDAGDGCRLVVHVGDHSVPLRRMLLNYIAEHNDRVASRCDEVDAMLEDLALMEAAQ